MKRKEIITILYQELAEAEYQYRMLKKDIEEGPFWTGKIEGLERAIELLEA